MKITIAGDLFIGDFYSGKVTVENSLQKLFQESDFRIVNLESAITPYKSENKILKTGPHLRSSSSTTAPLLKILNIDAVTLANNHILDFGKEGLADTLTFCNLNGIKTVGAGLNLKEAKTPLRIKFQNKVISIINVAENEWSNASNLTAGAHPLDTINNSILIKNEKKLSDFVVLIIHGGHEFYQYPSPRMQKQYRYFADQGADIIIGHHPHCLSGYETYNESSIFYSLGNFLFPHKKLNTPMWSEGLILSIDFSSNNFEWNITPVLKTHEEKNIILKTGSADILKQFESISSIIKCEDSLYNEWELFLSKKESNYLNTFSPFNITSNRYLKKGLKILGLDRFFYRKKHYKEMLNFIRCEAHREVTIEIFQRLLKK
jgi:hypothetical protein